MYSECLVFTENKSILLILVCSVYVSYLFVFSFCFFVSCFLLLLFFLLFLIIQLEWGVLPHFIQHDCICMWLESVKLVLVLFLHEPEAELWLCGRWRPTQMMATWVWCCWCSLSSAWPSSPSPTSCSSPSPPQPPALSSSSSSPSSQVRTAWPSSSRSNGSNNR